MTEHSAHTPHTNTLFSHGTCRNHNARPGPAASLLPTLQHPRALEEGHRASGKPWLKSCRRCVHTYAYPPCLCIHPFLVQEHVGGVRICCAVHHQRDEAMVETATQWLNSDKSFMPLRFLHGVANGIIGCEMSHINITRNDEVGCRCTIRPCLLSKVPRALHQMLKALLPLASFVSAGSMRFHRRAWCIC